MHDYARIKANGKEFTAHAWQPYRWDITGALKAGAERSGDRGARDTRGSRIPGTWNPSARVFPGAARSGQVGRPLKGRP